MPDHTVPLAVIGYARVSTAEQEGSGHGLDAQEAGDSRRLRAMRGWRLKDVIRDMGSGKDLDRQELYAALRAARARRGRCPGRGEDGSRYAKSLIDFASLLEWFQAADARALIALDFDLDTSTPTGELIAQHHHRRGPVGAQGDRPAHE